MRKSQPSNLVFASFVLIAQVYVARSSRVQALSRSRGNGSLCIGCTAYPEAADYEDDWRKRAGLSRTFAQLQPGSPAAAAAPTADEKWKALRTSWEASVHEVFNVLQGQACMDLCAVCLPSASEVMSPGGGGGAGHLKLTSIRVSRAKNWQDHAVWPAVMPVDSVVGGAAAAALALPLSLVGLGVVGTTAGLAAGGLAAAAAANATGNSLAGHVLGTIAGASAGLVSGGMVAGAGELLAASYGVWKGVGLTASVTDCKRVGFTRSTDGSTPEEQPFETRYMNRNYGLKRLRQWMEHNKDWRTNIAREEVGRGDEGAVRHCERVREHTFDLRHASECLRHSQLCGPGGGLLVPTPSASMCRSLSNISLLEETAVALGDDEKSGFFASWRKLQEQVREESGFDGRRSQCIRTLCEYGGFRKASLKLHPDRLQRQDIPEDEKTRLGNIFRFLSSCKVDYTGSAGDQLTLNQREERDVACSAPGAA